MAGEGDGRSARHSQLSGRLTGVPQHFLKLLPNSLLLMILSFKTVMESFPGAALQIQIHEIFEFYAQSILSFSLDRCQVGFPKA